MLKGISFTAVILSLVSLAPLSFFFPGHRRFADASPDHTGDTVIMFGMGTELSLKDFADVLRMPKAVMIGLVCHYTIACRLWVFSSPGSLPSPPEVAAGIILIGCCPAALYPT